MIDRIIGMAPESARNSMQYKMATEFARGIKKDLKLLPAEQVRGFANELSNAMGWVVNGSMDDFNETENDEN